MGRGLLALLCWLSSGCAGGTADERAMRLPVERVPVANGEAGPSGPADDRGTPIGTFVHTFYWMEFEADYPGPLDTPLRGDNCQPLADVPQGFADRLCVEGSGRLQNGALLNLSGPCSCGYQCPETGVAVCLFRAGTEAPAWGYGSDGNPLVPLRSLAIDEGILPYGTMLYIPEWDGVAMPASNGLGGFVHDGCFRVDDIGYGVEGMHYDLYAGTAELWRELEGLLPTHSSTLVYRDPPRCARRRF